MNIRELLLLLLPDLEFIDILPPEIDFNNLVLKFSTQIILIIESTILKFISLLILIILVFEFLIIIELELVAVPILDIIVTSLIVLLLVVIPLVTYS